MDKSDLVPTPIIRRWREFRRKVWSYEKEFFIAVFFIPGGACWGPFVDGEGHKVFDLGWFRIQCN